MYYVVDDNVFIKGDKALLGYYAWSATKHAEPSAGGPGAVASSTTFGQAVANAANADRAAGKLVGYFQGQCWYRVFIVNNNENSALDKVIVARNHIYDVNVTNIKGPGIADPNKIILPDPDHDEPVLDLDTYVSATINVVDWHKVGQSVEVESK